MNSNLTIPAHNFVKDLYITVRVSGLRVWQARVWLGTKLMLLAGWVMGCHIAVELKK